MSQTTQIDKQQLSQEELQRTQVLNLKDVEETVRFEKRTSKKPAIIVAVLGIICITIGSSFAFVQTMNARKASTPNVQTRKNNKPQNKSNTKSLDCTFMQKSESNGINTIMNINYVFKDEKLTSFTKTYSMVPLVEGNEQSKPAIQNFINALQPFLIEINGYKLKVVPESTGGVITTTEVNLEILDVKQVPELNQKNFRFNIEYQLNTPYADIQKAMTENGYKCK